MVKHKKIAFLFPGQGAQYPGMGKDFYENYSAARLAFEEADDVLEKKLSKIILEGSNEVLTETINSQLGIYVVSMAIYRVIEELFSLQPFVCSGLSLGEYSALTASEKLSFIHSLPLIQHRAQAMSAACSHSKGCMVAVLGLNADAIDAVVKKVNMPHDLWVANYNAPGQVVLSGTVKGIEAGTIAAEEAGAKKIIPLHVQGAFHSGLMLKAEQKLKQYILDAPINESSIKLVMNVPGHFVKDTSQIKENLIKQVTHSVRWQQGVQAIENEEVDLYIAFGPGKTLSGLNKRIITNGKTIDIDSVEDLDKLNNELRA